MIQVMHIDEETARNTTAELIKALGDEHALSKAWIAALRRNFGLRYQPERKPSVVFARSV
jgi:hypothetical protein